AMRLGESGLAPALAALTASIDGPWAAAIHGHATANSQDGTSLEQASSALETMGALLVAAELLSDASVAHARLGLRARAAAASRRSETLLRSCEGARTPALAHRLVVAPLSRREREIAVLAAGGATNAEIAEALS